MLLSQSVLYQQKIIHFIALHLIFLHHMIYCGSQESTALFLILSTGPSVVFPLLLDAGNNCVLVIFSSKTERRKVLTSDIFVILSLLSSASMLEDFIGQIHRPIAQDSCSLI